MANLKDIKRRIHSVQSTMQITKAMELVASSKLRKAKDRAEAAQPFFEATYKLMAEIAAEDPYFNSQFVRKRTETGAALLIVIAGDRGLAGGFNSNVLKIAQAKINEIKAINKMPGTNGRVYNVPMENVMTNVQTGHASSIKMVNITVDQPLPDRYFTQDFLATGK